MGLLDWVGDESYPLLDRREKYESPFYTILSYLRRIPPAFNCPVRFDRCVEQQKAEPGDDRLLYHRVVASDQQLRWIDSISSFLRDVSLESMNVCDSDISSILFVSR